MLKLICVVILVYFGSGLQLYAADLFGNQELKQQEQVYQEYFGTADKEARSDREKVAFAEKLYKASEEKQYEPIREYMQRRIYELVNDNKKIDALRLRIAMHKIIYANNAQRSNEYLKLLEMAYKAAGREERAEYARGIAEVLMKSANQLIVEEQYEQAEEAFDDLSDWYMRAGDKESAQLAKIQEKRVKQFIRLYEDFLEEQVKADKDPQAKKAHAESGRFLFSQAKWSAAIPYLKQAQSPLHALAVLADQYMTDESQVSDADLSKGLDWVAQLLEDERDDNLCHRLLAVGILFMDEIKSRSSISELEQLRITKIGSQWPMQLEQTPTEMLAVLDVVPGRSMDEQRLIRLGWKPIFDHENPLVAIKKESGHFYVKDRKYYMDLGPGNCWTPNLAGGYQSYKLFAQFELKNTFGGTYFGFTADGGNGLRLNLRDGQFVPQLGNRQDHKVPEKLPILEGPNEITVVFDADRKELQVNINGKDIEPLKNADPIDSVFWNGGGAKNTKMGDNRIIIEAFLGK